MAQRARMHVLHEKPLSPWHHSPPKQGNMWHKNREKGFDA